MPRGVVIARIVDRSNLKEGFEEVAVIIGKATLKNTKSSTHLTAGSIL